MAKLIMPVLALGGVALAIIVGQRMSTDAMAVVIGVAVGTAASVPTSILLIALLRRERRSFRADSGVARPYQHLGQPNVIVINPNDWAGAGHAARQMPVPLPPMELAPDGGLRRMRVVGNDDEWTAGDW